MFRFSSTMSEPRHRQRTPYKHAGPSCLRAHDTNPLAEQDRTSATSCRPPAPASQNLRSDPQVLARTRRRADESRRWHRRDLAQVATAWVASRGADVVPVIAARNREQRAESLGAADLFLSGETWPPIEEAIPIGAVSGDHYQPSNWPRSTASDKQLPAHECPLVSFFSKFRDHQYMFVYRKIQTLHLPVPSKSLLKRSSSAMDLFGSYTRNKI